MFFAKQKPHAGRQEGRNAVFFALVTLTFKLIRARDQPRLPSEFGVNPFSGFRYIYVYTQTKKPQTDGANSLRAVKSAKFKIWDKLPQRTTLISEIVEFHYNIVYNVFHKNVAVHF